MSSLWSLRETSLTLHPSPDAPGHRICISMPTTTISHIDTFQPLCIYLSSTYLHYENTRTLKSQFQADLSSITISSVDASVVLHANEGWRSGLLLVRHTMRQLRGHIPNTHPSLSNSLLAAQCSHYLKAKRGNAGKKWSSVVHAIFNMLVNVDIPLPSRSLSSAQSHRWTACWWQTTARLAHLKWIQT